MALLRNFIKSQTKETVTIQKMEILESISADETHYNCHRSFKGGCLLRYS